MSRLLTTLLLYRSGFYVGKYISLETKIGKAKDSLEIRKASRQAMEAEVAAAWDLGFGAYSITNLYCTAIAAVFVFLITTVLIDRKVIVS